MLSGVKVLDVSTDRGGGVWAVSVSKVYYFPPGSSTPVTYDQSNGLARGWQTWTDPWFTGTPDAPATWPLTFSAVGGANPGQAIVGNIGAIADKIQVDPKTGKFQSLENFQVTKQNCPYWDVHVVRVIGVHKIIVALEGPFNGTAYLGGWHGFYAVHGLNGDCGCQSDWEEHQHFIPNNDEVNGCDSSGHANGCYDGDVWGLAFSPQGDVWAGDRHFVQRLKQGTIAPDTKLADGHFDQGIDVFPDLRDEVHGLAVDVAGGVWVASDGNGLAYLKPDTFTPIYWSQATTLPLDNLHGAVVDLDGDLWIGTDGGGLARYHAPTNKWMYYTSQSGLAGDNVNAVYLDQFANDNRILVATDSGVTVYRVDAQLAVAP
jgi:hypothetical protein